MGGLSSKPPRYDIAEILSNSHSYYVSLLLWKEISYRFCEVFINSPSEDEEAVVVGSAVAEGHKGVRTTMKAKTIEASVACLFN